MRTPSIIRLSSFGISALSIFVLGAVGEDGERSVSAVSSTEMCWPVQGGILPRSIERVGRIGGLPPRDGRPVRIGDSRRIPAAETGAVENERVDSRDVDRIGDIRDIARIATRRRGVLGGIGRVIGIPGSRTGVERAEDIVYPIPGTSRRTTPVVVTRDRTVPRRSVEVGESKAGSATGTVVDRESYEIDLNIHGTGDDGDESAESGAKQRLSKIITMEGWLVQLEDGTEVVAKCIPEVAADVSRGDRVLLSKTRIHGKGRTRTVYTVVRSRPRHPCD